MSGVQSPKVERPGRWPSRRLRSLVKTTRYIPSSTGRVARLLATGSDTWGQRLGGSIATLPILPLAALATSVTKIRLTARTTRLKTPRQRGGATRRPATLPVMHRLRIIRRCVRYSPIGASPRLILSY